MSNLPLFPETPNDFDLHQAIKAVAAQDLKACPLSRTQVADKLSELLHAQITESNLDAILAESKANRFPAEWVPAWTKVTGSTRILSFLCDRAGVFMADATDKGFADLGRAHLTRRRADEQIARLERELEGPALRSSAQEGKS